MSALEWILANLLYEFALLAALLLVVRWLADKWDRRKARRRRR